MFVGHQSDCNPLFWTVTKLSTFAHIKPAVRLCGMRGRTPKYKFGFGTHSDDTFDVSPTTSRPSDTANDRDRRSKNARRKAKARKGQVNGGWSIAVEGHLASCQMRICP